MLGYLPVFTQLKLKHINKTQLSFDLYLNFGIIISVIKMMANYYKRVKPYKREKYRSAYFSTINK